MPALPKFFEKLTKQQRMALAAVFGLILIGGGLVWHHEATRWTTTNNAYVQADTAIVSPQTVGFVAEILVSDNETVAAGQPLVRLDTADAQAELAQARANLAAAQAAVGAVTSQAAEQASAIAQRSAAVTSAQAQARVARTDLDRYGILAERGLVAPQRLQSARAGADQANAGVAEAVASLQAQRQALGGLGSARTQALAQVRAAQARVEMAELALERTVITAPVSGVVGALSARVGQYVRPGAQILAVVPLGQTYVVANFKETQLGELRIGQRVEIHVDAFPNQTIHGRVESFAPASGAEFALIPVEHASGNFTRITQRLPVRIALDDQPLAIALRPGLSLDVRVDTRSPGGANFAEAATATPASIQAGVTAAEAVR